MGSYLLTEAWSNQRRSYDESVPWEYQPVESPKEPVSHYDNLLQRAADLYAALDTTVDEMSTSGSDSSYRSSPERSESVLIPIIAQVKRSIPDKVERRREQNRSSQRAYRERKERHQKELEQQISQWQRKHQLLFQTLSQQNKEVHRLRMHIEALNRELSSVQPGLSISDGPVHQSMEVDVASSFEDADAISPRSTPMQLRVVARGRS